MQWLLATVRAVLFALSLIIFLSIYYAGRLIVGNKSRWGRRLEKNWCQTLCYLLNIETTIQGDIPREIQTYLFISNHRSFMDPLITLVYINAVPVAKAEIKNYPVIGLAGDERGLVWVNRGDRQSRRDTRDAIHNALVEGRSVLVYPEGTVHDVPGELLPFKGGAFKMAARAEVPVIPIAISYGDPEKDFWKHSPLLKQFADHFGKWKTKVFLRFGEIIVEDNPVILKKRTEEQIQSWVQVMDER